jgi:hypothetical protein
MIAARLATLAHGQKKGDTQICGSAQPEAAAKTVWIFVGTPGNTWSRVVALTERPE